MNSNETIEQLQQDIAEIMYSWYGDSKPGSIIDEE